MPHMSLRSARALLLPVLLIPACERRDQASQYEAPPATTPAPTTVPSIPTPAAPSPISSADELPMQLDAVHENFLKKDLGKAGDALKSAAERLKDAATSAPAGAKKDLTDAADGLARLEGDVRSGAQTSIEKIDHRLAMASASLARYHYLRATDAWVAQDARTTGQEMTKAVDQLEAGAKRLGQAFSGEAATMANHVRDIGRKLSEGAQLTEADVGTAMKGLGREIEKLATKARASL